MRKRRSIRHLLHTAVLMLVLCCAGHIHGHVCLDGQEAASTVHFENLGGHPEHDDDASHADVENELMPQVLLGKTLDYDSPVFLTVTALLLTQPRPLPRPVYVEASERAVYRQPADFLPPPQAPPTLSA